jgi:hypothetical protein
VDNNRLASGNGRGDICRMRFQCEVTRIEKAHLGVRDVALECLGAGRQKKRIVLSRVHLDVCRSRAWSRAPVVQHGDLR